LDLKVGAGIDCDDILRGIKLRKAGSRLVGHAGAIEYRYGRTVHRAGPYPHNPALEGVFKAIRQHLQDPSITQDNYCALFTLFMDGKNHLRFYSDNEPMIEPDSDVITASFGSTRDLVFRSTQGEVQRLNLQIPHGAVYVMSRSSQEFWEHRIPESQDPSLGKKVTVGLRRLRETKKALIPRIKEPAFRPQHYQQPEPEQTATILVRHPAKHPRPKRVLLLLDSIVSCFQTDMFPDPTNIECLKKPCYELHKLHQFESELGYSDVVFISCGIWDLSRRGDKWDAPNLFRYMHDKLEIFRVKYPRTTFVFNSLLETRFSFVNRQVNVFNDMMFEYSLGKPNVLFFDSHHIATSLWMSGAGVLDVHGNGVNVTNPTKEVIASAMTRGLTKLASGERNLLACWPLRVHFRDAAEKYYY